MSATSSRAIWMAERLTLTESGSGSAGQSSQPRSVSTAVSSAQRPSATIRPDSSATGMNSVGEIGPRRSWSQRASASKPEMAPVREIDQRLKGKVELAAFDRASKLGLDAEAPPRGARLVGLVDLDLAARLGPLHRELGVAQHLLGQLLRAAEQGAADRAIDPDLELGEPERRSQRRLIRSAACIASSMPRSSRISTPNSSPPVRARTSPARKRRNQAAGEGDQQSRRRRARRRIR